jgi:hypothetical protein
MKYQFRPYAKLQPIEVTLTGKIYEVGEHPIYKEYKIIEVVDEEGGIIDAFEDELTSDEVKEQERIYSEEEFRNKLYECLGYFAYKHNIKINGTELDSWCYENLKK